MSSFLETLDVITSDPPARPVTASSDRTAYTRIYMICGLLAIGQFTLNTSVWMLTGLLQPLSDHFGVSVGSAGQVISVFTLSYAIGAPLVAIATAGVDRKVVLIAALAVSAVANLAAAMAPSFGWLLLSRMVGGAADGLYGATATAAAVALAPAAARGRFLALLNTGLTLAMFIGVPVSTLLGTTFGWHSTFFAVAAFAGLGSIGLFLLLPSVESGAATSLKERLGVISSNGALPVLAIGTLSYIGMFTVYSFIAPILNTTAGVAPAQMSTMLLIFGLAAVIGNWLGGQATDRWGEARSLGLSLVLLAPLLAALPFLAQNLWTAAGLLFVWALLHYSGISPLQLMIARRAPANPGVAVALMNSFIYGGVALGAASGGLLIDNLPLMALGAAGATFKLAALGVLIWVAIRVLPRHIPVMGRDGNR